MPTTKFEQILKKHGVTGVTQHKNKTKEEQKKTSAPTQKASVSSSKNTKFEQILKKHGVSVNTSSAPTSSKYTDFNTESQNAYKSAKDKVYSKTSIKSNMSDDERNKRIKEINVELSTLNSQLIGYSRASAYGSNPDLKKSKESINNRISELKEELKTLERTGTFSASELKQFEIDDAKAKVSSARQKVNSFGARRTANSAEAYKQAVSELYKAKQELEVIERQKELYDDIAEFGVTSHADDFLGQWRANYRSNELSREADKAMSEYISNPTEENKQLAYAYDAFAKAYMKNNEKALDDENVKASWLTKSMAGYLPQFKDQIVPEVIGGGVGLIAGSAVGAPNVGMSVGAGIGTFSQMYDVTRGSVYRTLLAEGVDEETALQAANDEALISSLIESGETALSWLMAGGGKAIGAISNAAKTSVAKGSTNTAVKFLANFATNRAAKKAAAEATRPLWNKALRAAGGVALQGASEYVEEFTQGAVSRANQERAIIGNADGKTQLIKGASGVIADAVTGKDPEALAELHEQGMEGFKIGVMFGGSQATVNNIVSHYANAKTVKLQNEVVDTILEDEESLDALIEEGKASGEGTVSAKLAEEVEQAKENGTVTREQVKQLIESNEVYIKEEEKNAPDTLEQAAMDVVEERNRVDGIELLEARRRGDVTAQILEELTRVNAPITNAEAKKVTGFGDRGAELVANNANAEGATFYQTVAEVKPSYTAGFQQPDLDIKKVAHTFTSKVQEDAYTAGQMDGKMLALSQKEHAKNVVVHKDSGFNAENLPSDVTESQVKTLDLMAKALGVKSFPTEGLLGNAELNRETGEVPIDVTFEREVGTDGNKQKVSIVFHAAHEMAVHRVCELAPEEGNAFVYAMYKYLAGDEGSEFTLADEKMYAYAEKGVAISLSQAREEVTANNILRLYNNNEAKFHKAIERIVNGTDTKAKQGLRKYIDALNKIIRNILDFLLGKSAQERAEIQTELDDIIKLRDMFETTFAKAAENRKAIQAKTDINSTNNLENEINEVYNENVRHSLKDNGKIESEQFRTMWTIEEGILTKKDVRLFYSEIQNINNGSQKYEISADGDYILDIENKLIYTDGEFDYPTITRVVVFASEYENDLVIAKELVLNEARVQSKIADAIEIIEEMYGEGFVLERYFEGSKAYAWQNRRGKRTDGTEANRRSQEDVEGKNFSLKDSEVNSILSNDSDDMLDKKDVIGYVQIKRVKMKTFPPYNESESDANEWSTRWAHREDVESGAQTLVFYHNRCYVIGKYDSAELKYQIEGRINYKDYITIRKELEEDARKREKQRQKKMADFIRERNERGNTDEGRGQSLDYSSVEYGRKDRNILRLDRKQDGEREVQSNVSRSDEYDGKDRQAKSLSEDKTYSLKGTNNTTSDGARKMSVPERLAKYAEDGVIPTDFYDELVEKYGAIPSGEKPHRDVQVPRKTEKSKKVSQTVRTILEAKATPDEAVPTIEKMVEDGIFSYDVYTDKAAIEDGENYIKTHGWEQSLVDWFEAVNSGEVSKEITTTGWILYNHAANSKDTKTAIMILDAMVRHQRSAAQALQATRILKTLSPEGQLYGVQKSVEAFQKELVQKYGDKAPDLQINEELAEKFLNAETEEERLDAEIEIYKDIGRQMPSNWLDKWNAWRYIAMLTNPRTHIRNTAGNAMFAPVVIAKDLTATMIESIVAPAVRLSGQEMVRGKSFVWGSKADRALLKAAWNDYDNIADIVSNGGKYNDSAMGNKYIQEGRRIFKGILAPVEWVRRGNSKLLEWEDMWFSKLHYAYALAQYCKANNITAEQISRGKAIAPAREYAIKEAQKATYRDTNAFSQFVSELGRSGNKKNPVTKGVSIVLEGILPFRKTPANILVRGVEYSPIGLLKSVSRDLYMVSKGKMTASEAIDNISAGLTGTGLLALGVYFAAQGLVRGHGEDDKEEKEFKEMMGHQSYSLELPNGESITLDWLAPEALPFFVGVNVWETTKGSEEDANLSSILQSVTNITEPMLEMSCLQGLNDLIEGLGYASSNDTSGLVALLSSATTSYLTQGIPTLSGQAERTGEEERMTTYTEKNSFLTGDMQYTLGKASAKIPFWDYNQIPYIDAWGRKEASGTALKRGLNNFLNPAYTSTIEMSDMEEELLRLYEQTGDGGVFPARADKYFTVDGERKDLTAEEYVRYATLKGEKSYKLVSDLVASRAYQKLSATEQVKAIKEAYDYANQKAKQTISNYKPENWVYKADEFGSNVGNYISFKTEVNGKKEANGGKISKQEVVDIVLDMAQNDSETWKMYLSMYDSSNDLYAYDKGINGEDYMHFLETLAEVDAPTKTGKYGTFTQEEAKRAVRQLEGLSREEKAILYQSVNTSWKKNPFR